MNSIVDSAGVLAVDRQGFPVSMIPDSSSLTLSEKCGGTSFHGLAMLL